MSVLEDQTNALLLSIIQNGGIKTNSIADSEFQTEVSRYSIQELIQLTNKLQADTEKENLANAGCLVVGVGRRR
jgi:hypothetical protein